MKSLKHENGEILIFKVDSDIEAIRSNLLDRLSIVRGEYLPDTTLGIPLGANQEEIDLNVQRIILNTSGVLSITSFKSTLINKIYKCKFEANTIFGRLSYV